MRHKVLMVIMVALLAVFITGCGGGHQTTHSKLLQTITEPGGQRAYKVRLPNGKVVIQAHSPALAEPPQSFQLPRPLTGVSTVEQFDSTVTSTVPRWAHYAAGYVNGHWPTYFTLKRIFPVVVGISVSTNVGADCFDMEPGNPGPQNAGPWALWQFTQGNARPCEYSMLSWMPSIRTNLSAHGVAVCYSSAQTHCVRLWDADWTYRLHLDSGYACTQWTDHSLGLNLDESTCATWFYNTTPLQPVCFHRRESMSQCATAKNKIASYRRAVTSSQGAYNARHCEVFAQRIGLFSNLRHQFRHDPRYASWGRALTASQRVYNRRACGVFASRAGYYSSLIQQVEAAN